jgi:hypothetical protein
MTDWRDTIPLNKGGAKFIEKDIDPDEEIKIRKKRRKKLHRCPALECLLCKTRFTEEKVVRGDYNIETFICSSCYKKMQDKPHEQSCFGKPTTIFLNGKKHLGYEPEAVECTKLCPDRILCQRIVRPDLTDNSSIVFL